MAASIERLKEALEVAFKPLHIYKKGDMATYLGYAVPYFSGIINGKEVINDNFLNILSDKLNINKDYITTGHGEILTPTPPPSRDTAENIGEHSPLSPKNNNDVFKRMEHLLSKIEDALDDAKDIKAELKEEHKQIEFLVTQALQILTNAVQLNGDMRTEHKNLKELYDNMYAMQQNELARAQEYLDNSKKDTQSILSGIKHMLDVQAEKAESTLKIKIDKVLEECKTFTLPQ